MGDPLLTFEAFTAGKNMAKDVLSHFELPERYLERRLDRLTEVDKAGFLLAKANQYLMEFTAKDLRGMVLKLDQNILHPYPDTRAQVTRQSNLVVRLTAANCLLMIGKTDAVEELVARDRTNLGSSYLGASSKFILGMIQSYAVHAASLIIQRQPADQRHGLPAYHSPEKVAKLANEKLRLEPEEKPQAYEIEMLSSQIMRGFELPRSFCRTDGEWRKLAPAGAHLATLYARQVKSDQAADVAKAEEMFADFVPAENNRADAHTMYLIDRARRIAALHVLMTIARQAPRADELETLEEKSLDMASIRAMEKTRPVVLAFAEAAAGLVMREGASVRDVSREANQIVARDPRFFRPQPK